MQYSLQFGKTHFLICFRRGKVVLRLKVLRKWLLNCRYPESVIDKSFSNAKLQGPTNKPAISKNILPLVSTYYSNLNIQNIVKSIDNKLEQIPNESINEIFGDTQTVFSLKQLPNLLRSPSIYRKIPRFSQGLFNCNNKNCKLCAIDVKPYSSFKAWNHVIWYIKSHIICQGKNVFYFLISASCNYSTKYIDKAVYLRSLMNNHITSRRIYEQV